MFVNPSRDFFRRKLDDEYVAVVMDNNDPKQLGRIKIRIRELHASSIPTASLPWAAPLYPFDHGGLNGSGKLVVPRIGSKVFVKLYRGDVYSLFYTGVVRSLDRLFPSVLLDGYPNTYGYQDPNGNYIKIKLGDNSARVHMVNGADIIIDTNGNITVTTSGYLSWTASNSSLDSSGNLITAGNITDLNGAHGTLDHFRTVYDGHTHNQPNDSHGDTEQPTNPPNQTP